MVVELFGEFLTEPVEVERLTPVDEEAILAGRHSWGREHIKSRRDGSWAPRIQDTLWGARSACRRA